MGKNVAKSVRLTDEIYCYIDGYRGNGFSDKFENIVYDSMLAESERIQRLAALDETIEERREELLKLCDSIRSMHFIFRDAQNVDTSLSRISSSLEQIVIQISSAAPAAAGEDVIHI